MFLLKTLTAIAASFVFVPPASATTHVRLYASDTGAQIVDRIWDALPFDRRYIAGGVIHVIGPPEPIQFDLPTEAHSTDLAERLVRVLKGVREQNSRASVDLRGNRVIISYTMPEVEADSPPLVSSDAGGAKLPTVRRTPFAQLQTAGSRKLPRMINNPQLGSIVPRNFGAPCAGDALRDSEVGAVDLFGCDDENRSRVRLEADGAPCTEELVHE